MYDIILYVNYRFINLVLQLIGGMWGSMQHMKEHKNVTVIPSIFELGFHIFDKWMKLKHEGKSLQKYFDDNYIKTVAIYGLGALGSRLFEDLQGLEVKVLYVIDKNAANINRDDVQMYTLEQKLPQVDAVIVTPIQFFYEIERELNYKLSADIISLEDVVEYCV